MRLFHLGLGRNQRVVVGLFEQGIQLRLGQGNPGAGRGNLRVAGPLQCLVVLGLSLLMGGRGLPQVKGLLGHAREFKVLHLVVGGLGGPDLHLGQRQVCLGALHRVGIGQIPQVPEGLFRCLQVLLRGKDLLLARRCLQSRQIGTGGGQAGPCRGKGGGIGLSGQVFERQLGQLEVVSGLGQLCLGSAVVQRGDGVAGLHSVSGPHVHGQQPAAGLEGQGQRRLHGLEYPIGQDRHAGARRRGRWCSGLL